MVPDPRLHFIVILNYLHDNKKKKLSERTLLCFVGKNIHFVAAGFMEKPGRASVKLQLLNRSQTNLPVSFRGYTFATLSANYNQDLTCNAVFLNGSSATFT